MTSSSRPVAHFCYIKKAADIYTNSPSYATEESIGIDLRACFAPEDLDASGRVRLAPGERRAVPSGIAIEPVQEEGAPLFAGFVYSRSGLGAVQGLTVAQGVGVIDPDYRGEITVILLNTSGEERFVAQGERIAQLVFQPVFRARLEEVRSLGQTERGAGGFGHTGAQ